MAVISKKGTFRPESGCVLVLSKCEQLGLQALLGAVELYREGSCGGRCLFLTSLAILAGPELEG